MAIIGRSDSQPGVQRHEAVATAGVVLDVLSSGKHDVALTLQGSVREFAMTTTRTRDDEWLLKARAIAPITEQHRDQGESEQHLPQAIYEAMGDTGLYKLLLAKVYGGIEADVQSSVFAIEEMALQDGAVGWNIMIGMSGGLFPDYLGAESGARIV